MYIDDEKQTVSTGDIIFIPAGSVQWLANTEVSPLEFLAMVNPPWNEADDIRLDK